MLKTLNFNAPLVNIKTKKPLVEVDEDGNVEEINKGHFLANALMASNKGDYAKYYYWATRMYDKKTLELDKSDFEKLKKFIEDHEQFTNLTKVQLIQVMDDAETSSKEASKKVKSLNTPKPADAE